MAMTPEAKVKKRVKQTLDMYGAYYFMPIGGPYSRAGVPDIIGCHQGRFFAIECKAGNNTPTLLQQKELARIRKAGSVAIVVNEDNLDDVRVMLESL